MRRFLLACVLLIAVGGAASEAGEAARHGSHVEKWPNGKRKIACWYQRGVLHGTYREYNEQGRLIKQCSYKNGALDGQYRELYPSGRPKLVAQYRKGTLHGRLVEVDEAGRPVRTESFTDGRMKHARPIASIAAEIKKIKSMAARGDKVYDEEPSAKPVKLGRISRATEERALAHLNVYRYLAGSFYRDITIGDEWASRAQHGAVMLAITGGKRPSAKPAGVSEEFYKLAAEGVKYACGHDGGGDIPLAIDHWMRGARPGHITHRRWMLSAGMLYTGFGMCGKYQTCWAVNRGRKRVPPFEAITCPAEGFQPVEYFGDGWAWSVSLSPARFVQMGKDLVKAKVCELDEFYREKGEPLKLDKFNVDTQWLGDPYCISFVPQGVRVEPGARYRVVIEGLKRRDDKPGTLSYVVEFCKLPE